MRYIRKPDRRDGFLLLIGALSLLLGFAYAISKVPPNVHNSLSAVTRYVPLHYFGALWLLAGFLCISSAFFRRPSNGFAFAAFMPTVWGAAYLYGWLAGEPGRGYITAGIFWALAGAIACVSGLMDADAVVKDRLHLWEE